VLSLSVICSHMPASLLKDLVVGASEDDESSPKEEVQVSPKLDFRTASSIQMPRSACRDVEGSVFVN
jgi:hypothetical protein